MVDAWKSKGAGHPMDIHAQACRRVKILTMQAEAFGRRRVLLTRGSWLSSPDGSWGRAEASAPCWHIHLGRQP